MRTEGLSRWRYKAFKISVSRRVLPQTVDTSATTATVRRKHIRVNKSTLERVTPLGQPRSIHKSDFFMQFPGVVMAKWPWRSDFHNFLAWHSLSCMKFWFNYWANEWIKNEWMNHWKNELTKEVGNFNKYVNYDEINLEYSLYCNLIENTVHVHTSMA